MTTVTGRLKYGAHADAAGCKIVVAPQSRMRGTSCVTVPDKGTEIVLDSTGAFSVTLEPGYWVFTEIIGAAIHTEVLAVPDMATVRYETLTSEPPEPWPTGITVEVSTLEPGSDATATVLDDGSAIMLGIPRGATGETGPQGDQGPQGIQGEKGDTGDAGPANSLSIGTVTTGDAGTAAAATLTGQPPSQVLNLTIPRGVNGDGAVIQAGTGLTVSGAGTAASPLVIAQQDTGWRNIMSLLTYSDATFTGLFRIRRVGAQVFMVGRFSTDTTIPRLKPFIGVPLGFKPPLFTPTPFVPIGIGSIAAADLTPATMRVDPQFALDLGSTVPAGAEVHINQTWLTGDTWPSTLPGTAA